MRSGVKTSAYSDVPVRSAKDDALGFSKYVQAVADFLLDPDTVPPLTMSIEGEWGSGKSSFLRQLEEKLKAFGQPTIFFNAWRHDKDESLWAGFALECIRQLQSPLNAVQRFEAWLRLQQARADWLSGSITLLRSAWRLCISGVAIAILAWYMFFGGASSLSDRLKILTPPSKTENAHGIARRSSADSDSTNAKAEDGVSRAVVFLIGASGVLGNMFLLATLFKSVKDAFGDPYEFDIRKYFADPGYRSRIGFAENFHADFSKILGCYAKVQLREKKLSHRRPNAHKQQTSKIFILIDDLDRCDAPKAAELMQAINLLTSASASRSSGPIFIIGMDREIVAGSLAARYKDILQYLEPGEREGASESLTADAGLSYGYAFMEKFIQLPFRIRRPRHANVKDLFDKLDGIFQPTLAPNAALEETSEPAAVEMDSERIRAAISMVAEFFDYNPRRLKLFVNLFRLTAHISIRTATLDIEGLRLPSTFAEPLSSAQVLEAPVADPNQQLTGRNAFSEEVKPTVSLTEVTSAGLTFEKLAKFLAIVLRWPRFVDYLNDNETLLTELQLKANDDKHESKINLKPWCDKSRLMQLLGVCENSFFSSSRYIDVDRLRIFTLTQADVAKLTQIAPTPKLALISDAPAISADLDGPAPGKFDFRGVPGLCAFAPSVAGEGVHDTALDIVIPLSSGGLAHFHLSHADGGEKFVAAKVFATNHFFDAATIIRSSYGRPGNLEVIARQANRIAHFWRDGKLDGPWKGPYYFQFEVSGSPVLLESGLRGRDEVGNFEVIVPLADGTLAHYWRDNKDEPKRPWYGPYPVASPGGYSLEPLAVFETISGKVGNLTAFALTGKRLEYIKRENYDWQVPVAISSKVSGRPVIIASVQYGSPQIAMLVPDAQGGLCLFRLDEPSQTWRRSQTFARSLGLVDVIAATNVPAQPEIIHIVAGSSARLVYGVYTSQNGEWLEYSSLGAESALVVEDEISARG